MTSQQTRLKRTIFILILIWCVVLAFKVFWFRQENKQENVDIIQTYLSQLNNPAVIDEKILYWMLIDLQRKKQEILDNLDLADTTSRMKQEALKNSQADKELKQIDNMIKNIQERQKLLPKPAYLSF